MEPRRISPSTKLGGVIRAAREAREMSIRTLAAQSGLDHVTIARIESGFIASPGQDKLQALSAALELPLSDLYALAGYAAPTQLPTFTPYLRAKYRDLPPEAIAELQASFQAVAARYGYDGHGPAPGEDET